MRDPMRIFLLEEQKSEEGRRFGGAKKMRLEHLVEL